MKIKANLDVNFESHIALLIQKTMPWNTARVKVTPYEGGLKSGELFYTMFRNTTKTRKK